MFTEPVVYVVDGDANTRDFVRRHVESMSVVCKPCESGREFFEQYDGRNLGCVVLELRIADMSGLQIQRRLCEAASSLPVLFLSQYGSVSTTVRAMKAGAVDFLEKPCKEEDLWDAIQPAIQLSRLREEQLRVQAEWRQRLEALTKEEHDLLDFVVKGKRSQEIANLQRVSIRTVEARRSRLLRKLEAGSTNELLYFVEHRTPRRCGLTDHTCLCPR